MKTNEDPQLKIRLPADLLGWLNQERAKNRSTHSSEIARAVRERKERTELRMAA